MTEPLRSALAEMSEQAPPIRIRPDLWRAGRRRHRRRAVIRAATCLSIVALVAGLAGPGWRGGEGGQQVAAAEGAVPIRLHQPYRWQGTVQQVPNGPAALLMTGGGSGLATADLPGTFGSRVAVVGRDGSYRMLRYGSIYLQAAQDVLLSPDGRYVAGDGSLESLFGGGWTGPRPGSEISVVDLVDGSDRRYRDLPAGWPVAWSPDGGRLVLQRPRTDHPDGQAPSLPSVGRLWLLDRATGATRELTGLPEGPVHRATFLAFSPDGRRLAIQVGQQLLLVDTENGGSRVLTGLGPRDRLAGAGAWTPDGGIAVYSPAGCFDPCTDDERNQRRWQLRRLDAGTGAAQPAPGGFADVVGAAVRIVGWQHDGDVVVLRYLLTPDGGTPSNEWGSQTEYRAVGDVELLALRPGGGSQRLIVTPPGEVWDLDVAHDLVVADRFGGPAPAPAALPAAPWTYTVVVVVLLIVAAPVVLWWRWRRGRLGRRRGSALRPPVRSRRGSA